LILDVFCHLSESAHTIQHPERVYAYLWQVTLRSSWNLLRKHSRWRRFSEEIRHLPRTTHGFSLAMDAHDLLARLSADERRLLVERHCEGWTLEQMARRDGVSRSTLKRHLQRAQSSAERLLRSEWDTAGAVEVTWALG
jgi:RNA polymerase sigma factor (sigma-70 family)